MPANGVNFTFDWQLMAADSHTTYSGVWSSRTIGFVDACTLAGATPWLGPGDNFDLPGGDLPFPVTIFNVTGTQYALSPEGVFSLDPNLESGSGPNAANVNLPAAGESAGTVFPFWTSQITRWGNTNSANPGGTDTAGTTGLSTDSPTVGQVCTAVEGSAVGSRVFDVTWENMRVCTQPDCSTASDEDTLYTYTVRFFEGTETTANQHVIEFQYNVMNDQSAWTTDPPTTANQTLSTRSRGATATIGMQGSASGAGCGTVNASSNHCALVLFDTAPASALPTLPSAYPRTLKFTPNSSNNDPLGNP